MGCARTGISKLNRMQDSICVVGIDEEIHIAFVETQGTTAFGPVAGKLSHTGAQTSPPSDPSPNMLPEAR